MAQFRKDRPNGKSEAFWNALRLVEQCGRQPVVLVPVSPNERMRAAGAEAGGVDERTAQRVYRAMIAAADQAGPR